MAKTNLKQYTVQEKLNKMDIDIIDITATLTGDGTTGDLMFDTTEIPNCVPVNGGTAIVQSIVAIVTDDATDTSGDGANITGAFKLVFTSDSTSIGTVSDLIANDTSTRAVLDGICGIVPMSIVTDHGYFGVYDKRNVGTILKAASGTSSMYVYGITNSGNDYNGATITLRIGVIKD